MKPFVCSLGIVFLFSFLAGDSLLQAKEPTKLEIEANKKGLEPYMDYHPEMDSFPVEVEKKEKMEITPFRIPFWSGDKEMVKLAVADFSGKNVSAAESSIASDFIRSNFIKNKSCKVVERSSMDTSLQKAKYKKKGCSEPDCGVKMGKILNVDQIVVGNISKLGKTYFITANLIEVKTGKILKSEEAEANNSKEIKSACEYLSQKLSKK
ncbi:MAG: hypothetical protein JW871_05265 [Endomicrobiales bacterium]|nr:hypothetical protein [Endomicrobiales bacterium]